MNTYKIVVRQSSVDEQGRIRFYETKVGEEQAANAPSALRQMWAKAVEAGIAKPDTFVSVVGRQLAVPGVGVFHARKVAA